MKSQKDDFQTAIQGAGESGWMEGCKIGHNLSVADNSATMCLKAEILIKLTPDTPCVRCRHKQYTLYDSIHRECPE